jgi:hypothetical protein
MPKSKFALITILDGIPGRPVDPGYGQGHPSPPRPDQGLPGSGAGGGRPDNTLPGQPPTIWPPENPPGPDNTLPDNELPPGIPVHLPVFPPEIDNSLPGSGGSGGPRPDNTLPGGQGGRPDNSLPRPDQRFELKYSPLYGWVLVPCKDDGADSGARPDNTLPPHAQPKKK